MKCLNCGKEIKQLPKKREKIYCNSTCRSNYWQKSERLRKQGVASENIINKIQQSWKTNVAVEEKIKIETIEIKSAKIIKEQGKPTAKIEVEIKDKPKHKLWKEGDPIEGTNAFYIRKGAFTYDELEKLNQ
jgi:TPP-dependent pyruvate/acetoin dehydrogenase alpha subunit